MIEKTKTRLRNLGCEIADQHLPENISQAWSVSILKFSLSLNNHDLWFKGFIMITSAVGGIYGCVNC